LTRISWKKFILSNSSLRLPDVPWQYKTLAQASFAGMNQVYEAALDGHKPARSAFQVGRLPKDALVEIECIAVCDKK